MKGGVRELVARELGRGVLVKSGPGAAILCLNVRAWKEQPVNVTLLSGLKSAAFLHLLCGQLLTCAPFLQLNVRLKKLSSEP